MTTMANDRKRAPSIPQDYSDVRASELTLYAKELDKQIAVTASESRVEELKAIRDSYLARVEALRGPVKRASGVKTQRGGSMATKKKNK